MRVPSSRPRLNDMIEAIERLRSLMDGVTIDTFEGDWRLQWLVQRGVEIISEASRHLPDMMKARHLGVPWRKVAGIGNVLRHDYEKVAAPVIWALVWKDLPPLEEVCRAELAAEEERESS